VDSHDEARVAEFLFFRYAAPSRFLHEINLNGESFLLYFKDAVQTE
jgi:hypothetical protein